MAAIWSLVGLPFELLLGVLSVMTSSLLCSLLRFFVPEFRDGERGDAAR
jgi:hypothetical protein